MRTLRLIILIAPWAILVFYVIKDNFDEKEQADPQIHNTAVLMQIEALGKLELVKYNFKEITEIEELSKKYLSIFQLGPDSKIALISHGEAVGCIDLEKLSADDIRFTKDTLYISLPNPELCYYKLDLAKSRIYSLQTNPLKDERAFVEKAYKTAEKEIRAAALNSGILEQTRSNAKIMLKPFLENVSGKTVVFVESKLHLDHTKVDNLN